MTIRALRRIAFPLALFLVNFAVCYRLFFLEYSHFMNSIEGAYVSISRYAIDNWRDLFWCPLWYTGIPYQNSYPPLLHLTVAAVATAAGISPALSHHAVIAFFYCLGPVLAYWMALRLSGSRVYSFWAGLAWSLVSPSAFLIENVRVDMGSIWHARRLETLTFYGDGPHVSALSLLPLAIVSLDLAMAKRRPLYTLLAALSMVVVALTNWLGAVALAAAVVSYLLAKTERLAGSPTVRTWARAFAIGGLAYLMASPWVPPSTIRTIQFNAQTIGADYRHVYGVMLRYGVIVLLAPLLAKFLFARWKTPAFLQFACFFLFFMGGITLAAEWGNIFLAPQPHRYHLEMELGICLAAAAVAQLMLARAPFASRCAIACIVVLLAGLQLVGYRNYAHSLIRPIDMKARVEYKTAKWFDEHMQGLRVMAPAAASYWLNAFTDTPQLGGGFEQGATNWENRVALYVIYSGENAGGKDAEYSLLWLKAFGVHAIAMTGPNSEAVYKPYRNPRKFDGLLQPLWRDGDDTIYRVPARSPSLAHAVLKDELVSRPPVHGLDVEELKRHVAALDNPDRPPARFTWRSRRSADIVATLRPEHLLSVQISYHAGWHATANARGCRIYEDGIGLMVIAPDCDGPCTVKLYYDGGLEMKLARMASWASLLFMIAWIAFDTGRRRWDSGGAITTAAD